MDKNQFGEILTAAIASLVQELTSLEYGMASLALHVREGRIVRFVTTRERSHVGAAEQAEGKK